VAPDSTVRYQTVTVGRDLGSWVEVTGGLAVGSVVVIIRPTTCATGPRAGCAGQYQIGSRLKGHFLAE